MHDIANGEPTSVTALDQGSDDRFRLLVDAVKEYGIFMLDLAGNVSSWNSGAEMIAGYRAGEILGQHVSRFYTAEDAADGKPDRGMEIARSEGRFEDEGLLVRKGGSPFWAAVSISTVHDDLGSPVGFATVVRDITERKYDEEMRDSSERRFRARSITPP